MKDCLYLDTIRINFFLQLLCPQVVILNNVYYWWQYLKLRSKLQRETIFFKLPAYLKILQFLSQMRVGKILYEHKKLYSNLKIIIQRVNSLQQLREIYEFQFLRNFYNNCNFLLFFGKFRFVARGSKIGFRIKSSIIFHLEGQKTR